MAGPFCLVVNPAAGGGRARRVLPAAVAALDAAQVSYRVVTSASLGHAREIAEHAAQLGHPVVAVGGDGLAGALAGVVAAARGAPAGRSLGIIPAGRGNDFARVLAIPSDPARAAQVLAAGNCRVMDLIAVSAPGQPEAIAAGSCYSGIPAVAGQIANQIRWLRGPTVYRAAALLALARWKPAQFRAEVALGPVATASLQVTGYAIVVANSAYFGAGMKVAPPAEIDDGELDLVIMRHGPKLAFLRALARIRDGSQVALPQISLDRCTEVTVTVGRDMPAAADGEVLPGAAPLPAGTPLRIRVLPGALRVLAPATSG
jgi:diacylglycerol kinase (ATP)